MHIEPGQLQDNPFALLTLIGAPAVLTNAASVLALSTSNRFLRAAERVRGIAARLDGETKSQSMADLLLKQLNRGERQAVLLLVALRAAYVGLGSFASASLISVLGAALASSAFVLAFRLLVGLALLVGFVGAGGLVIACFNLLRASQLAVLNISEEAALIRERQRKRAAPPEA